MMKFLVGSYVHCGSVTVLRSSAVTIGTTHSYTHDSALVAKLAACLAPRTPHLAIYIIRNPHHSHSWNLSLSRQYRVCFSVNVYLIKTCRSLHFNLRQVGYQNLSQISHHKQFSRIFHSQVLCTHLPRVCWAYSSYMAPLLWTPCTCLI